MWRNNRRKILGLIFGLAIVVLIAGVSGVFGRTAAVEVPTTVVVKAASRPTLLHLPDMLTLQLEGAEAP